VVVVVAAKVMILSVAMIVMDMVNLMVSNKFLFFYIKNIKKYIKKI